MVSLRTGISVALAASFGLHVLLLYLPLSAPPRPRGVEFIATLDARLVGDRQPPKAALPEAQNPKRGPADKAPEISAEAPEQPIPGIVIPVFATPEYVPASRLAPSPKLLEAPEPVFPDGAAVDAGSVVVRLRINEQGGVDDAAVLRAQPPGLFEQAALEAFRKARFSPGRMLGIAVKSELVLEVQFNRMANGESGATRGY